MQVPDNDVLSDRYELKEPLGSGGMAGVYLARDRVLNREVAVKVLSAELAADPDFVERFRREAQAAARLSHPNIVSVYDSGSDGGRHYIVMELVRGKTLADVLGQEGKAPPEQATAVTASVADALAYAHEQGLIHRDIKPGNIMLTPAGQVKVVDFGIARAAADATGLTRTGIVLGTVSYLSPEQASGGKATAKSDIYSLGVVLFEMLAGTVPFTGESAVAVAYRHAHEEPERPSQRNPAIPPAAEAVVMRAMAKDPAGRFASAAEMKDALQGVDLAAPPAASQGPAGVTEPISRTATVAQAAPASTAVAAPPPTRPRRSPWPWVFLVGGALLVLILALVLAGQGNNPPAAGTSPHARTTHAAGGGNAAAGNGNQATPTNPPASESPPPQGTSVANAASALLTVVDSGVQNGTIDPKFAEDIHHRVDDILKQYSDGNLDSKKFEDLRKKVEEAQGKGDISSADAHAISAAIARLEQATGGGSSGDQGD